MARPSYGRYAAPEAPSALRTLHVHNGVEALKAVDHETAIGVLDQSDLLDQAIHTSVFIPECREDVDQLGSCTANATFAALGSLLVPAGMMRLVQVLAGKPLEDLNDTKTLEEAAICFYHVCTSQTADPAQEWPPTDCGSSGPYIVSELERLDIVASARVAHGPDNVCSLLQRDGVLLGSPWLYAWEEPGKGGFVDGNGSPLTLEQQISQGIAGGHETYIAAIEKIVVTRTGAVDARKTVLRIRNSWGHRWGEEGCCRIHLSTLVALGGQCDFRRLVA